MAHPENKPHWARRVLYALIGTLLYAGTSWVTSFAAAGSDVIGGNLRPGVAIPLFCGFAFGPFTGFVVGFFGNLLNDWLAGRLTLSFVSPHEFVAGLGVNWQFGNGLLGLLTGFAALRHWHYRTRKEIFKALLLTLGAVAVGIGVAVALDPLVYTYRDSGLTLWAKILRESFLPITLSNWINAGVIVPILLFNYEHLDRHIIKSFARSGLMRRLLLTVVLSAIVPIILLSLFLLEANARINGVALSGVFVQLVITVLLTTLFIITNAALMAQSMSKPLLNLSRAAQAMEKNTLSVEQVDLLKTSQGDDELAQLSRMFGTMAQEVIQREQELRKHVQELQIMIDEHKRSDQVKEIVETDFFRDLKQKARTMRERGKA
ncbi:MAG: ECF transporter S component, partial [Chloroflexales bacterium]